MEFTYTPGPGATGELRERVTELLGEPDEAVTDALLGFAYQEVARVAAAEMIARWRMTDALTKARACWPDPFGNWTADQADAARAVKAQILGLFDAAADAPTEETKTDER